MEAVTEEQKIYFDGNFHCAMDQHLNQLAGICQRQKDYSKTEEIIGQSIELRIKIYGDDYDGVLLPMMRMANFQKVQQLDEKVTETCKKGIQNAKKCLETDDAKANEEKKSTIIKYLLEFHEMLFHQYAVMNDADSQLETSRAHSKVSKEHCGDQSIEYASALYLEAKILHSDELTKSMAFSTVKKSIQIWKNTPLTFGP